MHANTTLSSARNTRANFPSIRSNNLRRAASLRRASQPPRSPAAVAPPDNTRSLPIAPPDNTRSLPIALAVIMPPNTRRDPPAVQRNHFTPERFTLYLKSAAYPCAPSFPSGFACKYAFNTV